MLNEEKIRLMTRAAAYETHEGKRSIPINHYFRGDYIGLNLIWSVICYTLVYGLCLGLWGFYKLEFGKQLATYYVAGLIVYVVITYFYYSWKYKKNRKSLSGYYQLLKHISAFYEAEGKAGGSNHTAGGTS